MHMPWVCLWYKVVALPAHTYSLFVGIRIFSPSRTKATYKGLIRPVIEYGSLCEYPQCELKRVQRWNRKLQL